MVTVYGRYLYIHVRWLVTLEIIFYTKTTNIGTSEIISQYNKDKYLQLGIYIYNLHEDAVKEQNQGG